MWRRVPEDLFRFTTTDLRDLHTALLCAFEEAAVLQPALRLDDVRAALAGVGWDDPVDDDRLRQALASLAGWQLLDVTQDHSAHYSTPEEFERRNLQWSLTERGQAAIAGVLEAIDHLRRAVGLQPAVLDAIAEGLTDLHTLVTAPAPDDARIATTVAAVEGHLESLVASVRQFNSHLQRLLREDAATDEVFLDVKQRTVTYLKEYVEGVERPARRVAAAITRLQDVGVSVLHDHALRGANLAPLAGDDPSPHWLADRARRWEALVAWFAPTDGSAAKITTLRDSARTAILNLLRVLDRRWSARRRSASVASDFRVLAGWFACAADEGEAHRLYNAAFGLWPSRHAHLAAEDAEEVATTTSWSVAPPVVVPAALRTSGSLQTRGRTRPVGDARALRARRQREQAEELARHDALRAALVTTVPVPLSRFAALDADEFRELLLLMADALGVAPAVDGTRRALSADGQVEIVLHPPAPMAQPARVRTAAGVLTGPDFGVSISLLRLTADAVVEAVTGA